MHTPESQGRKVPANPPAEEQPDAERLECERADFEAELERLLILYLPRLKQFAVSMAVKRHGRAGEVHASDIVQSIIGDGLPGLRKGLREGTIGNPYAWLCQRVKWKLGEMNKRDHAQKRSVDKTRHLDESGEAALPDPGQSPSKQVRTAEEVAMNQQFIRELDNETYEQVLQMAKVEELKVEEIARRLDTTKGNVHQITSRGLKKLRDRWMAEAPEHFE